MTTSWYGAELASTIETLKERNKVRKIMASLKSSLPEVYQVLRACYSPLALSASPGLPCAHSVSRAARNLVQTKFEGAVVGAQYGGE